MNNISFHRIILFSIICSLILSGCSSEDEEGDIITPPNTIEYFVESNPDYSSLNAALIITDLKPILSGSAEFTVFAPNNAAFNSFLSNNGYESLQAVPVEILTRVLLYHMISGKIAISDLASGYLETASKISSEEYNLSLYFNVDERILINGQSSITGSEINLENGIIHTINNVLSLPDISTFLEADPNFEMLYSTMTREEDFAFLSLLEDKDEPGPFTLFAPSNEAFVDLWRELGVEDVEEISKQALQSLLSYHITPGENLNSSEFVDGFVFSTLESKLITVQAASKLSLLDEAGRVSNIVKVDIQATNGIIHVIDKVLLPE